jgi:ABC-type branched-subunit amino acid transport system ATPase component
LVATQKELKLEKKTKDSEKEEIVIKILEGINEKIQFYEGFTNLTLSTSTKPKRTISSTNLRAQSTFLSEVLEECNISLNKKDQAINDIIREAKEIRVLEVAGGRVLLFTEKPNMIIDEFMAPVTKTAIEKLNTKLSQLDNIEKYSSQKSTSEIDVTDLKMQALDAKEISKILSISEEEALKIMPEIASTISGVSVFEIDAIKERVEEALKTIELEPFAQRHPHALSRGQRHRVAVASVLAMHPKILVLDEPTNGQDYGHTEALMRLVKKISREGTTVVIISHDMKLIAKYCERIIVLRKGEILLDGSTSEIFSRNELLESTNLQPPKVTQVAQQLGQIEDVVLTTEQFVSYYT